MGKIAVIMKGDAGFGWDLSSIAYGRLGLGVKPLIPDLKNTEYLAHNGATYAEYLRCLCNDI